MKKMAKNNYLIEWQAFQRTSYVEKICAKNEIDAIKKIGQNYQDCPEYKGCEIKILSMKQVS